MLLVGNNYLTPTRRHQMTPLAKEIMRAMDKGMDSEQILANNIGSSVYEVEFIMAQIEIARGK